MKGGFRSVLSQLRRVILRHSDGGLSDGQLLDRFIHQRDETAFEVLVWRYGPMVLGVARRVLHNLDDAEDILQATFLSLVRQARSIRRREAISGWLYQVAYRLALRARQQKKKRSLGQVPIEDVAATASSSGEHGQDEVRLLDEELQRLPEKYRIPLVLSYLQGMTNEEIAARMTCPIGTVFTRLARGREMLRIREWYIDDQTLLPLRVELAGMGIQMIDYIHSRVNQPIPDKEFSPDKEPGVKDGKAQPLDKDYTYRFLNIIDGSNGRMSVRWGEKGPKGTRSSGLN